MDLVKINVLYLDVMNMFSSIKRIIDYMIIVVELTPIWRCKMVIIIIIYFHLFFISLLFIGYHQQLFGQKSNSPCPFPDCTQRMRLLFFLLFFVIFIIYYLSASNLSFRPGFRFLWQNACKFSTKI